MPKDKGTKQTAPAERVERRREVEKLLALQYTTPQICRALAPKYDVSERMIRLDIEDAITEMATLDAEARPHRKNRMRETWLDLYRRCIAAKNFAVAHGALDKLCRMDGLYEAEKFQVTHTHEDARAEIDRLDDAGRKAFRDIIARIELAKRIGGEAKAKAAVAAGGN